MAPSRTLLKSICIAALIFISVAKLMAAAGAPALSADMPPDQNQNFVGYETNQMSSNWWAAVKIVLPASDFAKGMPPFEQLTNLLGRETEHGNNMALGLWGAAIITYHQSPDELKTGVQMMQTSAQRGYVAAMLSLGFLSESGQYYRRNYDDAFYWFGLAATHGSAEGELQYGACFQYGFGTKPDLKMTAKCYLQAAEMTNYVAMKSYGYLLMNGLGVETNAETVGTARYWFTRAAKEGGNRRAMYDLGAICDLKFPDTNALAEAFQWFQQSAELGDALACAALAECYRAGWGTATNLDSYHLWIYKAAMLGATEAQYRLGAEYRAGDGVPEDMVNALAWYEKAAAKNHPEACYDLALYYLGDKTNSASLNVAGRYMLRAALMRNREAQFQCALYYSWGRGLPQDGDNGRQWLATAANNGWAKAEFVLFGLYYRGGRIAPNCPPYPQDKTEALKWLRRAAEHGDFRAQSTLGDMLVQGKDMDQNVAGAEKFFRNAASHGYAKAQNDLGYAILHGDIGSMDWVEAAMWCQLAEAHWDDPKTRSVVEANLSNALARLAPGQEAEVQQRVQQFHALPVPETWPLLKGWEQNPDYHQEDGNFGH